MPTETRRGRRSAPEGDCGPPPTKPRGKREPPKAGREGRPILRDTTNVPSDYPSAAHTEAQCSDSLAPPRPRRSSRVGEAAREPPPALAAALALATSDALEAPPGVDGEGTQPDSVTWLRTRPKRSFGHASSRRQRRALFPSDTKRSSKVLETTAESLWTLQRTGSEDEAEATTSGDGADEDAGEALKNPPTGVSSPARHRAEPGDADRTVARGGVAPGQNYGLGPANFDPSRYTNGVAPHDAGSQGDVRAVPEYVTDIFQRLYDCESRVPRPTPHREVGQLKRAVLMGWMVFVQTRCKLLQDSLHLAYNVVDRYLSMASVPDSQLQLVGAASLLIASKYEEEFPARVNDLVRLSDRAYTRTQVIEMESTILFTIDFRVSQPTSHAFLRRFLFMIDAAETTSFAASYYLELALQDSEVLVHRPSLVALAVTCLAINQPDVRESDGLDDALPGVPPILTSYSGYSTECISSVARQVAQFLATRPQSYFEVVDKKYRSNRYGGVAKFDLPAMFAEDATM